MLTFFIRMRVIDITKVNAFAFRGGSRRNIANKSIPSVVIRIRDVENDSPFIYSLFGSVLGS